MIRVIVTEGQGDRPAGIVSDPMISVAWMAYERAKQEMLGHRAVFRERSLDVPHQPKMEVGDLKEIVVPKMDLYGANEITSLNITIGEGLIKQSVSTRQILGFTP